MPVAWDVKNIWALCGWYPLLDIFKQAQMIFVKKKSLILFIMVINYFIRDTLVRFSLHIIQLGAFCSSSSSVLASHELCQCLAYNHLKIPALVDPIPPSGL